MGGDASQYMNEAEAIEAIMDIIERRGLEGSTFAMLAAMRRKEKENDHNHLAWLHLADKLEKARIGLMLNH